MTDILYNAIFTTQNKSLGSHDITTSEARDILLRDWPREVFEPVMQALSAPAVTTTTSPKKAASDDMPPSSQSSVQQHEYLEGFRFVAAVNPAGAAAVQRAAVLAAMGEINQWGETNMFTKPDEETSEDRTPVLDADGDSLDDETLERHKQEDADAIWHIFATEARRLVAEDLFRQFALIRMLDEEAMVKLFGALRTCSLSGDVRFGGGGLPIHNLSDAVVEVGKSSHANDLKKMINSGLADFIVDEAKSFISNFNQQEKGIKRIATFKLAFGSNNCKTMMAKIKGPEVVGLRLMRALTGLREHRLEMKKLVAVVDEDRLNADPDFAECSANVIEMQTEAQKTELAKFHTQLVKCFKPIVGDKFAEASAVELQGVCSNLALLRKTLSEFKWHGLIMPLEESNNSINRKHTNVCYYNITHLQQHNTNKTNRSHN